MTCFLLFVSVFAKYGYTYNFYLKDGVTTSIAGGRQEGEGNRYLAYLATEDELTFKLAIAKGYSLIDGTCKQDVKSEKNSRILVKEYFSYRA